jgi:multidrug efflux pump
MILSDFSIKRPVFATVLSLLLIVFGIVSYLKLPLREYPDIDPPIISIETNYPGASADIVESRITEIIEDKVAGIEGIRSISSASQDGRSSITIEFDINRDIDNAANDVRDRVSTVLNDLPVEADPPEVQKASSDDDVIIWLNFTGDNMSVMELTDYARRYIQDQFSALDGVARVRIGGAKDKAMRIWLDRKALAARNLSVEDVENALRRENIQLPAGQIQSIMRDFTVRVKRLYVSEDTFKALVIKRGEEGYLVRLGDVARVEIAPVEERGFFRGNGVPMVGIGIIKQSKANTLNVAHLAKQKMADINARLPKGMSIEQSYDTSIFIDNSIKEVYKTLFIAIGLVILVIYLFLGSIRAMLIPAVTVPISLIATFIVLLFLNFTINLLTLLALVLAIGLVVDDAIVVLENIHRRIELGEPKLLAAYRGSRQVGFAVIATTLVLVAVFIPITFLDGDVGRLFSEFAIAIATAVVFSSFVALSLCAMLASKVLRKNESKILLTRWVDNGIQWIKNKYVDSIKFVLTKPIWTYGIFIIAIISICILFKNTPSEFAPKEDRGVIFVIVSGPEGSSDQYTTEHMNKIEKRLMKFVHTGEFQRLLIRTPGALSTTQSFNGGVGIIVLNDWGTGRKSIWEYVNEIRALTQDITGVSIYPIVRQGLVKGTSKPVQFVLGGATYDELASWRDIILEKAKANMNLLGVDHDYKETKPQLIVSINQDLAGDLGVSLISINKTLESLLGSRRVTTYIEQGEEYDVIIDGEESLQKSPIDIQNIYVRSDTTSELIPLSNLVTYQEISDAAQLNRYNRLRSITLDANLADGYSLGEALDYLNQLVQTELPENVSVNYKGESLDYEKSGYSIYFVFILALAVVFLVMAGLFESFIHPLVIMSTVPLAILGALIGLWLTHQSLNIYSQIGMIMLVGLATKNGILIVEFINQLRDEGVEFRQAIVSGVEIRFRPILMTAITTAMGAIPLVASYGAGAESRFVLGVVILSGVLLMTFMTLYVIPVVYQSFAKNTQSPHTVSHQLESQLKAYEHKSE